MKNPRYSFSGLILSLALSLSAVPVLAVPAAVLSASLQNFQEGLRQGQTLREMLLTQLDSSFADARGIVTSAIASSPGSVREIILIAIDEGVTSDDIAAQCETTLTPKQLELLIASALTERIDPVPILETCLVLVPESEIPALLAIAINNSTPGSIELVIQTAYQSLAGLTDDPFPLVRTGVLLSNVFAIEGIEYSEDINRLLTEIRLQDFLETSTVDTEGLPDDLYKDDYDIDPEPPLSGS